MKFHKRWPRCQEETKQKTAAHAAKLLNCDFQDEQVVNFTCYFKQTFRIDRFLLLSFRCVYLRWRSQWFIGTWTHQISIYDRIIAVDRILATIVSVLPQSMQKATFAQIQVHSQHIECIKWWLASRTTENKWKRISANTKKTLIPIGKCPDVF